MAASDFYTGLAAELYEPLVGHPPDTTRFAAMIAETGEPALELACGTGMPMLDLVAAGREVVGLDASADMLDRCRENAQRRGLEVALHQGLMQSFELSQRFRTIFVASGSFTLLTRDEDARAALAAMHRHLLPGGAVWIDLESADAEGLSAAIGRFREEVRDGATLRCGIVGVRAQDGGAGATDLVVRLRYERIRVDAPPEVLERDWQRRCWTAPRFAELMREAGFGEVRCETPKGDAADAASPAFVARGLKMG